MQLDPAKVVVASEKLVAYLLSSTHPIGRYKSAFFLGLGFSPDKPQVLAVALREHLITMAESGEMTEFGQKVLARGPIQGPSGASARILAVWIILSGDSSIRFVTAYPEN